MANTFKIKTNDAMPTSAGTPLTLYTVPGSTTTVVLGLMLCNVHTSQVLVDVHIESDTSDTEQTQMFMRSKMHRYQQVRHLRSWQEIKSCYKQQMS